MNKNLFFLAVLYGALGAMPAVADDICTGATYMDSSLGQCIKCPYGYDYNTDDGKTDVSQCQTKCSGGQYVSEPRLASDGKAFINTGVVATGKTYVELVFQFTTRPEMNTAQQVYAVWGGIPRNYANNPEGPLTPRISVGAYLNKFFTGINGTTVLAPFDLDIHSYKLNAATGKGTFDGKAFSITPYPDMVMPYESYLYARQTDTGPDTITPGLIIYQYREYDQYGGTLLRDMVPSVDPNGVVCMYDYVTQSYTYNSGEGEFARPYGCFDVGEGYWAPESVVNYGTTGVRNACPDGMTTSGYGAGADEAGDCGHVLNFGGKKLYLRSEQKTDPALHVQFGKNVFYGSAGTGITGTIHVFDGDTEYTIYDDNMVAD